MKLGIDIGRVLIWPGDEGTDTSFLGASMEEAVRTPPYPGVFEIVPQLVERFGGQAWLVSKAYPRTQEKTRRWLEHHRFFERTGIPAANLRFCLERHQKAAHGRELGLTHFIDDRLDVLGHLHGIVAHRFLFGPQKPSLRVPADVTCVPDWNAALVEICPA